MQVKRFLAADMRRALEMVRQELGPDAVILSSNRTKDGVELLTVPATNAISEPSAPEAPEPVAQAGHEVTSARAAASESEDIVAQLMARSSQHRQRELEASAREFLQPNQRVNAGIPVRRSLLEGQASGGANAIDDLEVRRARSTSAAQRYGLRDESEPPSAPVEDTRLETLQVELAEMRYLLEEQLSRMMPTDDGPRSPVHSSVGRRLERLGLPAEVSAQVLESIPESQALGQSWTSALAQLSRRIPVQGNDPVSRGGVFALVGPTGAGKTTTIGKLAARHVMSKGAGEVALVTLDTHRIGGHDPLRSLARVLGVTLKVVEDREQLGSVLYGLRRHSLVLIDTAGFRPGDSRLTEQWEALLRQPHIQPLLVLPANSQPGVLKAVLHAYGDDALAGCVLSKLDECASLGEALGVAVQGGVPIVYTTDGQDIPKDLEVVRPHQLVTRAAGLISRPAGDRPVSASGARAI
ncbi:flagellar biosynthesis protein FlhF [Marinimicrobium sp. ARAG 43.8]|uniref:flagellar biosynthesis protein FlhF n=1 Tax=Marinimicrobium sp. ARAG 43.8 TaxID=3418719 RepID=UPI003CF4FF10